MSDYVVEAELREKTGRAETRRLRRAGKIPGIIYGGGKPELSIAMDYFTISKLLEEEHFHTTLLEISVTGSSGKNTAILKATQWEPIKDTVTHVDFQRVSSSDKIHIEVPVHALNHETCPGVKQGGSLSIIRHSLEVTCRADSIPESIEIDCASMEIGDVVHINDVKLPDGVEVQHDQNFTILNISAPKKAEEVEETAAAAEGEAEAPEAADEAASEE